MRPGLAVIANDHRGCTRPNCGTCGALRTGLAACLSVLRSDHQRAVEAQFDQTEPHLRRRWFKRSKG